MHVTQRIWTAIQGPSEGSHGTNDAQLVFVFGAREALGRDALASIGRAFPRAHLLGCSTAGEIAGTQLRDGSIVVTAVRFASTRVEHATVTLADVGSSELAGRALADRLAAHGADLAHVVVLSDGVGVNGSELVRGMTSGLPRHVAITGGLAADGTRFEKTIVVDRAAYASAAEVAEPRVAAIGLYGERVRVGYGSRGGWDPFGPDRVVTRSRGNVVYALDGEPALDLYERYLGVHAAGLPASGLLFPLAVRHRAPDAERRVVRTILAVDDGARSLTFAGDVPEGSVARLMKASCERLVDGAASAARVAAEPLAGAAPELALLISCIGRKLVLKQRVEDELERARDTLGGSPVLAGFYSYGEICPAAQGVSCDLHNQTMTITTLCER